MTSSSETSGSSDGETSSSTAPSTAASSEGSTRGVDTCGDDVLDDGEVCDGALLANESCITLGFDAGALACADGCDAFDTSGCCLGLQAACGVDGECCGGAICDNAGGEGDVCCLDFGADCTADAECCSGSCNNGQDYCELP